MKCLNDKSGLQLFTKVKYHKLVTQFYIVIVIVYIHVLSIFHW
jgi:hypothetical protein